MNNPRTVVIHFFFVAFIFDGRSLIGLWDAGMVRADGQNRKRARSTQAAPSSEGPCNQMSAGGLDERKFNREKRHKKEEHMSNQEKR
jgi:hypothetical protein